MVVGFFYALLVGGVVRGGTGCEGNVLVGGGGEIIQALRR